MQISRPSVSLVLQTFFLLFDFIKFLISFIFFLWNTFRYNRLYAKIGCWRSYTFGLRDREDFEKNSTG